MFDFILKTAIGSSVFFVAQRVFAWGIGKMILPAQLHRTDPDIDGVFIHKFTIPTKNGLLSVFGIKPQTVASPARYIIHFCANAQSYHNKYELKDYYERLADQHQATVILFDYPNVGHSKGGWLKGGWVYAEDQLIEAGIAVVQYLLTHGVPAEQITCYGSSLGGAVATFVTEHMHGKKQYISLINDRSFSSIGDTVAAWLNYHILITIFKPIFNALCTFFHWNLNAAAAYKKIPACNKMLIVSKIDEMIPYATASVYNCVYKKVEAHTRDQFVYQSPNAGHCDRLFDVTDENQKSMDTYVERFIGRNGSAFKRKKY